ncbi:MAG: DEAD/DEAH box helicase [Candidatus Micrarchaeota archaeon]|nr:DEAD/DEAH box helicase [Candidatus Micrarchaeota archaeon]
MKFSDMKISDKTLKSLETLNYIQPTEVQEKVIPLLLENKEVVVRSQTGTGKTAAFGIGVIEEIAKNKNKKSLILAPTRELAIQITKELRAIASNHRLRIFVVYGGEDIGRQFHMLKMGYDIVVATPGRLLDHFRRGTIDLSSFNIIVLDEADRMLDMGFIDDINTILDHVNLERKVLMFSATINEDIKRISKNYMMEPVMVEIGNMAPVASIEEKYIKLNRHEKFGALIDIIRQEPFSRIIIFVATQRAAEYVGDKLAFGKINAGYLHGGLRQNKREKIVRDFREGRFRILVATDVAARGLHVDEVSHIINYDEANDADTHTHRIGRTGRMGKAGKAITFVELDRVERGPRGFSRSGPGRGNFSRGGGRGGPSHRSGGGGRRPETRDRRYATHSAPRTGEKKKNPYEHIGEKVSKD